MSAVSMLTFKLTDASTKTILIRGAVTPRQFVGHLQAAGGFVYPQTDTDMQSVGTIWVPWSAVVTVTTS